VPSGVVRRSSTLARSGGWPCVEPYWSAGRAVAGRPSRSASAAAVFSAGSEASSTNPAARLMRPGLSRATFMKWLIGCSGVRVASPDKRTGAGGMVLPVQNKRPPGLSPRGSSLKASFRGRHPGSSGFGGGSGGHDGDQLPGGGKLRRDREGRADKTDGHGVIPKRV